MTLAANLAMLARRVVGLSAGNLVALDGLGKLPAVDGSQLVNLSSAAKYGTVVPLTGTAVDLTGIPVSAKKVGLFLSAASVTNTPHIIVQLGTADGIETSGYAGQGGLGYDYGAVLTNGLLAGWGGNAANWNHTDIEFRKASGNRWVGRMSGGTSNGGSSGFGITSAGEKTLAGVLDRVRITTVNGTDLLDAGTVTIWWE